MSTFLGISAFCFGAAGLCHLSGQDSEKKLKQIRKATSKKVSFLCARLQTERQRKSKSFTFFSHKEDDDDWINLIDGDIRHWKTTGYTYSPNPVSNKRGQDCCLIREKGVEVRDEYQWKDKKWRKKRVEGKHKLYTTCSGEGLSISEDREKGSPAILIQSNDSGKYNFAYNSKIGIDKLFVDKSTNFKPANNVVVNTKPINLYNKKVHLLK